MPYQEYLMTDEWGKLRGMKLHEAGHRCQGWCQKNHPLLDVHHITYDRLGDELMSDLRILCRHCHQGVHSVPRSTS
jgi:hypothetical protein